MILFWLFLVFISFLVYFFDFKRRFYLRKKKRDLAIILFLGPFGLLLVSVYYLFFEKGLILKKGGIKLTIDESLVEEWNAVISSAAENPSWEPSTTPTVIEVPQEIELPQPQKPKGPSLWERLWQYKMWILIILGLCVLGILMGVLFALLF